MLTTAELKRHIWHSRRGMLELDVLLEPFAKTQLVNLSPEQQAAYVALLAEQDPDIFGWLMRHTRCPNPAIAQIICLIQDYAASQRHP